jgi:hypothetical protein
VLSYCFVVQVQTFPKETIGVFMHLPEVNKESIWVDIKDIVKILNLIPSETTILRLPTKKVSKHQLSSTSWKEVIHCKIGEYEPDSIDIYCYRGEMIPNLIIYPEKLETRLLDGVPFFVLESKNVASLGEHVMRHGDYEVVALDKNKKTIINEKVNNYMYQNYTNRYLKGRFFVFSKVVPNNIIDKVILEHYV